jgi:hypothetical protein
VEKKSEYREVDRKHFTKNPARMGEFAINAGLKQSLNKTNYLQLSNHSIQDVSGFWMINQKLKKRKEQTLSFSLILFQLSA